AAVGGRFESGDPWMAVRRLGEGQVVQLSTSLDLSDGNLPLQQAFVPFLHELTYFLANPQRQELNLRPSWDFALRLGGEEEGVDADLGLRGDYYAGANLKVPQVTRTDRTIQFDWRQGSPAPGVPVDDFRVRWQGRLMVPKSGKWEFRAEVDDELELFLDGRSILRQGKGRKARSRQVWLEEGRSAELVVKYEEETENATVIVQWRGPGMPWQVIPPTAFRQSMEEKGNVLREFEVVGPAGRERKGLLTATAKGPVVKIQGDVAAGLYQMRIPSEERGRFAHLLPPESEVLPFTVTRDPEESALSPLTKGDREFLENYLGLLYPEDPGDVLRVLSGGSFGEELWRTLAVAALLFLLLESSLTRWISRSRQAGQEATVSFG
ncbi:MAG: PA14 domain-containing protein, partial [Verrucomicrobiota bacterium]